MKREQGRMEEETEGWKERDLSQRILIFLRLNTCKLKQFLSSEGQGPLSSSPLPTVYKRTQAMLD